MEKNSRARRDYRARTRLIHGRFETKRWDYNHHVIPPISASTAFRLESAQRGVQGFVEFGSEDIIGGKMPIYVYDRLDEPTRGMLEESLAYAESGEAAVTFASGMAAISAALGIMVSAGQEIIAHKALYGGTHSLLAHWLPRYGIATRFCDLRRAEALYDAITEKTRVVYFETPVNPTMELIDIAGIARAVRSINAARDESDRIALIIDNTFATPYCQRPLELGADIVVESLTKNIGGFGTDMGGAVVGPRRYYNMLMAYRRDFGGVLSPKSAWVFLVYGLPTLAARLANQQKSALRVAQFLAAHPRVARVVYPGLEDFPQRELARRQMVSPDGKFAPGSMLYFVLKGDSEQAADRLVDYIARNSYTITLAVSLGQIKTLIENPFSMTHASMPPEEKVGIGIEPGGIRLSIGLEDWQDIIEDLRVALEAL